LHLRSTGPTPRSTAMDLCIEVMILGSGPGGARPSTAPPSFRSCIARSCQRLVDAPFSRLTNRTTAWASNWASNRPAT
jgi:hypothetical protein